MISGYRLEGQIGNTRDSRTNKNLLEYTAGDIRDKGVSWMTNTSPNAQTLTYKGGMFDLAFQHKGKNTLSIAIGENMMRLAPYTEKQYIESYSIRWIANGSDSENYWRILHFYHVTVQKVDLIDLDKMVMGKARAAFSNIRDNDGNPMSLPYIMNYYNVLLKVDAGVEYKSIYGTDS